MGVEERVGRAIRIARRARGMSQAELAEASGVTRTSISNWERGANMPSGGSLVQIAEALGTTAKELLASAGHQAPALVRFGDGVRIPPGSYIGQVRALPKMPPRAYQVLFAHCTELEEAGVPEDLIEEARRLMSDDTFNTLNKGQADPRTEKDWIMDIEAGWALISDRLKRKGFEL